MKAITYTENGGPEVMQYGDLPDPELKPDTVIIRNQAISIEGGDLLNRLVTPPQQTPFIPGYQAAGIVEAVGANVTRFKAGDRVIGFNWSGSYCELFAVPETYAYPVPEGMDIGLAATIPVAFGTAYDALIEYGGLNAGEYVLVQGAAGGVGLAAIQFAARAGAVVIGTASGQERLEKIKPFGMDYGIDYTTEDIAARCREITGGKGIDLVVDLAGGIGKDACMKALKPHGRYAVVGAAQGALPSFDFFELIRNVAIVFGVSFGRDMHTERVHKLIADIGGQLAKGDLLMPIAREFPLSQAVDAHTYVANGHPFGRVLLRC